MRPLNATPVQLPDPQPRPCSYATAASAERPRTDGRGVESPTTAHRRGRLDAVIASLLFMGGLRRSEVSALEWRDVSDARDGAGVLLTVRTSKTNQEGDAADVRYLKNGAAKAIRTLRAAAADAAPIDRVVGLSPLQIQRRFTAAARAAGIEARDPRRGAPAAHHLGRDTQLLGHGLVVQTTRTRQDNVLRPRVFLDT